MLCPGVSSASPHIRPSRVLPIRLGASVQNEKRKISFQLLATVVVLLCSETILPIFLGVRPKSNRLIETLTKSAKLLHNYSTIAMRRNNPSFLRLSPVKNGIGLSSVTCRLVDILPSTNQQISQGVCSQLL